MKRLTELNPEWVGVLRPNSGEGLALDCPACGPDHRIAAHFKNPRDGGPIAAHFKNPRDGGPILYSSMTWDLKDSRAFETVTISPSIVYPCWHGWIERGYAINQAEAPVTVLAMVGGETKLVSLSPLQCLDLAEQLTKVVAEKFPPVKPAIIRELDALQQELDSGLAICQFLSGHSDEESVPVTDNTKPALEEFWRMVSARMPAC
jgi:hypothetical protein